MNDPADSDKPTRDQVRRGNVIRLIRWAGNSKELERKLAESVAIAKGCGDARVAAAVFRELRRVKERER